MEKSFRDLAAFFSSREDPEDREDGLDLLNQFAERAAEYVSAVVRMETSRLILPQQSGGEVFRARAEELDRYRTSCHEALLASVRALNRLLRALGEEPWYRGNEENRYDVASFAGDRVKEIFDSRSGGLEP